MKQVNIKGRWYKPTEEVGEDPPIVKLPSVLFAPDRHGGRETDFDR